MKIGTLVGTDKYGNKYFENNYYFYGRNRWVEYAPHVHMDYDGSQIPAEWFGWMHYKVTCQIDWIFKSENLNGQLSWDIDCIFTFVQLDRQNSIA